MGIRDAALISEMQEGYYSNDVLRSEPTAVLPSLVVPWVLIQNRDD